MGSLPPRRRCKADSVCIVGAGPSGLAAAKYLLAERTFSRIVIYEQNSRVGGLWNYTPGGQDAAFKNLPVPQTSPRNGLYEPIWETEQGSEPSRSTQQDVTFVSPVYERLEANTAKPLMGFVDLDWPDDDQLFPSHESILEYLEEYGKEVSHLVQLGTQVLDVRLHGANEWLVETRPVTKSGNVPSSHQVFDAVLVANGHHDVPYIPDVSGIRAWNEAYPGIISHSKYYRRPDGFAGKKVVVVGSSASGSDIGAQLLPLCQPPLLMSQNSDSGGPSTSGKVQKPRITNYILDGQRSVRFADGSVESGIDVILYCTGYLFASPFLDSLDPPVITNGQHVENTYQHIFYQPHPTLSFIMLNQKVVPFPLAEAQSAVVARVLSGRLSLPCEAEMKIWEDRVAEEMGSGRSFHTLPFPKDANHINMLHDWAMSADHERVSVRSQESVIVGKKPPYWSGKEYWIRERLPDIKRTFQGLGVARHQIRTIEDVGYDYAKWQVEQKTV